MFLKKIFSKRSNNGVCYLCDEVFSEKKLFEHNENYFCKNHLQLFQSSHWMSVYKVFSSSSDPEKALLIQELKDKLKNINISTYIETSYDEKDGEIFSYFELFCRSNDYNEAKKKATEVASSL